MRLWSIHPSYLDARGLVALWREGLLAQKVLAGKTSGYKNHPQLERFKAARCPEAAISRYLLAVYAEAAGRGYHFCRNRIGVFPSRVTKIKVSRGQLIFESRHFLAKLKIRDHPRYLRLLRVKRFKAHPSFRVVNGAVADWEK